MATSLQNGVLNLALKNRNDEIAHLQKTIVALVERANKFADALERKVVESIEDKQVIAELKGDVDSHDAEIKDLKKALKTKDAKIAAKDAKIAELRKDLRRMKGIVDRFMMSTR